MGNPFYPGSWENGGLHSLWRICILILGCKESRKWRRRGGAPSYERSACLTLGPRGWVLICGKVLITCRVKALIGKIQYFTWECLLNLSLSPCLPMPDGCKWTSLKCTAKKVSLYQLWCLIFVKYIHVNKQAQVNSSKTTKLHKPIGQVQFVVYEKVSSAYYTKLQEKSCHHLSIMHMKKHCQDKTDLILKGCPCYLLFALVLHKDTHFQPIRGA